MRQWIAPAPLHTERTAAVRVYDLAADWSDALDGNATPADISIYVVSVIQSHESAELRLSGYTAVQPGQIIEVLVDSVLAFRGMVSEIRNWSAERGASTVTVVARTREQSPLWKSIRYSTPSYPVGTDLAYIMRQILEGIDARYDLPTAAAQVPHSNCQLADMTVWEMLLEIGTPLLRRPQMGTDGVLRSYSIAVDRRHDWSVPAERVVSLDGSDSGAALTGVLVRWTDPALTEVSQTERKLGEATITAGFFQLEQKKKIWFSDDHAQRARDTTLVVKQSANSGVVPFCTEEWQQVDPHGGRLTVTTSVWYPLLAGADLALLALTSQQGDLVTSIAGTAGLGEIHPIGTPEVMLIDSLIFQGPSTNLLSTITPGTTTPVGHAAAVLQTVFLLGIMMQVGTGIYEIWGTPYDYVYALNTTEAYDSQAPTRLLSEAEIRTDLVTGEVHARAIAVAELAFRSYARYGYNAVIIDHLGVEVGDILEFADGSRLFVQGFERELTRGVAALLHVRGFRC